MFGGEVWSERIPGGCFVLMTSGKAMMCIQVMTGGCSEVMAGGRTGAWAGACHRGDDRCRGTEQVRRAVSLRPSSGQHPLSYDDIPYHLSLAGVGAMTDI